MGKLAWVRMVLACVAGLAVGIVFTALVNLVWPGTNLTWTIIVVCLASMLSALCGYVMAGGRKSSQAQKQAPKASDNPKA